MNATITQLLHASAASFSSHDSVIAQRVCETLARLCHELETGHNLCARQSATPAPACALLSTCQFDSANTVMRALLDCYPALAWRIPGFGRLPKALGQHLAVTELVGPDGMYWSEHIRMGVLLQDAAVLYPQHQHAAEELYHVLHGTARWGTQAENLLPKRSGAFIHHQPYQPHCIATDQEPLIALWGWGGDIHCHSYAMSRR